ncbi:unnamed protein product [Angiostrongylus costaricensis]|uniref:FBD domain-containing protein n=1 Tax=Angiostrongylus costaricensis TaxID=334426 RepID=A0A0R3Q0X4_ANGCS|nr:unnamed protein product [Angiostrongylus costaricensis]
MRPQFGGDINVGEIGEYEMIGLEVDEAVIDVTDENMSPGGTMVHGNDDDEEGICWTGLTALGEAVTCRKNLSMTILSLLQQDGAYDLLKPIAIVTHNELKRMLKKGCFLILKRLLSRNAKGGTEEANLPMNDRLFNAETSEEFFLNENYQVVLEMVFSAP